MNSKQNMFATLFLFQIETFSFKKKQTNKQIS